jgi:hypothetical protein
MYHSAAAVKAGAGRRSGCGDEFAVVQIHDRQLAAGDDSGVDDVHSFVGAAGRDFVAFAVDLMGGASPFL